MEDEEWKSFYLGKIKVIILSSLDNIRYISELYYIYIYIPYIIYFVNNRPEGGAVVEGRKSETR